MAMHDFPLVSLICGSLIRLFRWLLMDVADWDTGQPNEFAKGEFVMSSFLVHLEDLRVI